METYDGKGARTEVQVKVTADDKGTDDPENWTGVEENKSRQKIREQYPLSVREEKRLISAVRRLVLVISKVLA